MHGKTSNGLDRASWSRRNLALENALAAPSVVIVALPGIGTLKLPKELFDQHLLRENSAESKDASASPELLDAAQLEQRTGIPATWWMSQARERRLGEFAKRKTLLFNGYADQVAHLYAAMDLRKHF